MGDRGGGALWQSTVATNEEADRCPQGSRVSPMPSGQALQGDKSLLGLGGGGEGRHRDPACYHSGATQHGAGNGAAACIHCYSGVASSLVSWTSVCRGAPPHPWLAHLALWAIVCLLMCQKPPQNYERGGTLVGA